MKTITRIITSIFLVMMLLITTSAMAQWTTVKVHIQESDIRNVSGESFQNYKGLSGGQFEIVAWVEAVKDKGKVKFRLRTQSVDMVKYYMYTYRPGLKMKNCEYGKLEEHNRKLDFSPNEIGVAPFEQAMRSASATFDVRITCIVKDDKYGVAGFGGKAGWGYRVDRVFKNVKANGVFWADEPIETNSPIEELKIENHAKLVSFQINDSPLQTAVLDFVKKRNEEEEKRCKDNDGNKEKKSEDDEKAEINAKEIEAMKNKLQNQNSVAIERSSKADDFWNGEAHKSNASTGKDNEDFWNGGRNQTARNNGNSDVESVSKNGRVYLKDTYDIIKEWSSDQYNEISKLEGSNDFFILRKKRQENGLMSQNNKVIVDKKGNTVKIDGEEMFYSIDPRKGGGYTVIKYLSESLYNEKVESGNWSPRDFYNSSSEAINDVKTNIARMKEEIRLKRRNDSPNTVYFTSFTKYNVLYVKEIITNASLQSLITKSDYQVLSNY